MKMARVGDPFSEALISIVVDRDSIWRMWFALSRRDNTTFDPVMDDPQADAISLANLTDIECSVGRRRVGDTMLEADPTDHVARERLAG
jgi:hypothetical protein